MPISIPESDLHFRHCSQSAPLRTAPLIQHQTVSLSNQTYFSGGSDSTVRTDDGVCDGVFGAVGAGDAEVVGGGGQDSVGV